MGGELPPQAVFEAVLQVAPELATRAKGTRLSVIAEKELFPGLEAQARSLELADSTALDFVLDFVEAGPSVTMEDAPLLAVRKKRSSSMSVGIDLLKEDKIDVFLTTGNTGALVGFATLGLALIEGIEKAALLVVLPTMKGQVVVLDVGASVTFSPEQLLNHAKMGMAFAESFLKISKPKVGLLNIGAEEKKGTSGVKEGYQQLMACYPDAFEGNVEGREVFQGKVDVLVTDGFTGNVFLKTAEGASLFLLDFLKEKAAQGGTSLYDQFSSKFNYSEHPGALLIGVEGLVIKCHGYSDVAALISGIKGAHKLAHIQFLKKLKTRLQK